MWAPVFTDVFARFFPAQEDDSTAIIDVKEVVIETGVRTGNQSCKCCMQISGANKKIRMEGVANMVTAVSEREEEVLCIVCESAVRSSIN